MKQLRTILFLLPVAALNSCSLFKAKTNELNYAEMSAPVMPVWLTGDTSYISLTDIFPGKLTYFILGEPVFFPIKDAHNKVTYGSAQARTMRLQLSKSDSATLRVISQPKNASETAVLYGLALLNNTDKTRCDVVLKKPVKIPVLLTYTGAANDMVFVKGDFNGWNDKSTQLTKSKENVHSTTLLLEPGEYSYQLVVNGNSILDPQNLIKRSNGMGGENSVLAVKETRSIPHIQAEKTSSGLNIRQTVQLNNSSLHLIALWENQIIHQTYIRNEENTELIIPKEAKKKKRSYIRVFCASEYVHGNDLLIPLEYGVPVTDPKLLGREDLEKTVMYFAFIDRFFNGDKSNDKPLSHPKVTHRTNFQGGDIEGVRQKIEEGYFDSLGSNALWISPISKNPKGAWGDFPDPQVKFSAYHGYWPVSNTLIDDRFGNAGQLRQMLAAAHKHNNNVYLDYVAHHVHKEHPIYKQHPDWVTPLYLPDGRMNTELWDEQRLTTWFDTFLPTLDLGRPEVASYMVDSALFWLKEFEFDGFRHDATKHIPENFTRLLTSRIRTEVETARKKRIYQIGETYGSSGLIGSYLGQGLLDAQFDFNLYDAMLRTFAQGGSMQSLAKEQLKSLDRYGHHHLMGNISGNQDKPRFMSWADGSLNSNMSWNELKKIGHTRDLPLKNDMAYNHFLQFYSWLFTAPGIPVIYYGDEIGMTGANDPGNRNMMQFAAFNKEQIAFKSKVSDLAKMRTGSMALCYGDYRIENCNDSQVIISRHYLNETALIAINRSNNTMELKDRVYAYERTFTDDSIQITNTWSNMDSTGLADVRNLKLKPFQSAIIIYKRIK